MSQRILVAYDGRVVADEVRWARTWDERSTGLLSGPPPARGQALIIDRCRQVHTFGLTYPIDVVFCDRDWTIRHVVRSLRPRRVTRWVVRARYCIELQAGGAAGLTPGMRLQTHP